jgi:hypothetical protein
MDSKRCKTFQARRGEERREREASSIYVRSETARNEMKLILEIERQRKE